jgi:transposase
MGFDVDDIFDVTVPRDDGTSVEERRSLPVRAVRVFSSALLRQKLKTLDRLRQTEARRITDKVRDWQAIAYACATDAQRAADRHVAQHHAATHDLFAAIERIDGPARRGRGRPRRRPEPALDAPVHWRVRYTVTPVNDHISAQRLHEQATFILIRTRHAQWQCSDSAMIDHYRGQYHLEHGFAWLKSQAEINPMFIHTPHRIAAMGFIYCLGLLVWNLIQRTVRAHLKATGTGLPYHRSKPSANITTRFLFELFPCVQTITMTHPDGRREKRTLGIQHWQTAAMAALGTGQSAFNPVISGTNGILP